MLNQKETTATAEHESKDETITVRLDSGDRYRFEDQHGCELAMLEIGLKDDPHAVAIYLFGKGKMLGYSTVMK
jgi:hypothetical protein